METLKEFKQSIIPAKQINRGRNGVVYQIADGYAVKFYFKKIGLIEVKIKEDITTLTYLQHENEIAQILYENNISVPKPEGVFEISLKVSLDKKPEIYPGFVMEYINGKDVSMLNNSEKEPLLKLIEEELKKVRTLGINPVDSDYEGNAIWNPEKKKIYLIDFRDWCFSH